MSHVVINVLTVPAGNGETLEARFAARAGAVDQAPGFERFELLRPVAGTADYLVVTWWRSEADFTAWRDGAQFTAGHAEAATNRPAAAAPAATGSTIWSFTSVQQAGPRAADSTAG